MPKAYEQIRDRFIRMGESRKQAEGRAAAIFNSKIRKPGEVAMGPNYEARAAAASRKKGKR
jgi:hypothetical protein